jgi:hypothetical protein
MAVSVRVFVAVGWKDSLCAKLHGHSGDSGVRSFVRVPLLRRPLRRRPALRLARS